MPVYQETLQKLGARVLDYVPSFAHIVSMEPEVVAQVRELDFVRWVGPYQPAYKLSEALDKPAARQLDAPKRFNVYVISKKDMAAVVESIQNLKGDQADGVGDPGGRLLSAVELDTDQLDKVLRLPEVQFVEAWTPIENDMDNARIQGGADYLETQAMALDGYTGVGIRGHVMEGINPDHPDFAANSHRQKPMAVDNGSADSHGQATYGIVFGSGENDAMGKARGMLPNAQGFYTHNRALTSSGTGTGTGSRYDLVRRLIAGS